jgi:hypothetical protein
MTYDIRLIKNKKCIETMMAMNGMGYGSHVFGFANEYLSGDEDISAKETKIRFINFHNGFNAFCEKLQSEYITDKTSIGSDPTGWYYDPKKINDYCKDNNLLIDDYIHRFDTTKRLLSLYATAVALKCGISFG